MSGSLARDLIDFVNSGILPKRFGSLMKPSKMAIDLQSSDYERAIEMLNEHIHRLPDGTLSLETSVLSKLAIHPTIQADLLRSLEQTNEKIRTGDLDPYNVSNPLIMERAMISA